MRKLAIVGGGGWGTALACVLSPRFPEIHLWVREPEIAERMRASRINDVFLSGVRIPENIHVSGSLPDSVKGAAIVIGAMPSHVAREIWSAVLPSIASDAVLVSATKGLEPASLLRMTEVIRSIAGTGYALGALSGPSFASEVARGKPTALVAASEDLACAQEIQSSFSGPTFRVYAGSDPIGVEIGGALKNVIAIGAGICDGLRLGHNALAALITRGLAELTRLAVALGGRPETLSGLAGLGDLVLTCTGDLSRNRRVGLELAAGKELIGITSSTPMVAEGVGTTGAAIRLAETCNVELPICHEMHGVLSGARSPAEAIRNLMTRSLREEFR